ncbi:MAG: dihydroorotate dehydrogenase [Parvicellaceae bacterium]|jgi:dihydroorotate dehydrogenase
MYRFFLKPIFFLFDPEKIHYFVFFCIRFMHLFPGVGAINRMMYKVQDPKLQRELFGLKFDNPVGLAAGFDKNAKVYNQLANFGFGFIEIGTVTPDPQEGNPKKRLFRLPEDEALINRMGFNNAGVEVISERLKGNKHRAIIGGNIGKNTATDESAAEKDLYLNFRTLHPVVDYFVVNVSCPNVGSTARMNSKEFLIELLTELKVMTKEIGPARPILLKIGPDRSEAQLDEVIEIIAETGIDGVITTNTATDRSSLTTSKERLEEIGRGGLSGQPLKQRSTEVIRYLAEKSNKAFPIIGVGGIHSAEDAWEKIEAGADLVQVYTGFIYTGPKLVKRINKKILKNTA